MNTIKPHSFNGIAANTATSTQRFTIAPHYAMNHYSFSTSAHQHPSSRIRNFNSMHLIEVNNSQTERAFLDVARELYQDDPNWISPLEKDIIGTFNPEKNKYFKHGEAIRWILKNDRGELIGRIAAFIDTKRAESFDQPTGGVGFFECINDPEAAFLLFDTAKAWLEERGMEAMDGPINFGEKDRFWGCLVQGFDEPTYCSNYNYPYYQELFEAYGFQTYFEQNTYLRQVSDPVQEKFREKAERIAEDPLYEFHHLEKYAIEDFTKHFLEIYNKAWGKHDNFKPMALDQARSMMKKLRPVMDEKLLWFAYYNEQPIGFFIMIPEQNRIFKHLDGKLNFLGKLKYVYHKWKKTSRRIHGMAFGIVPEHQGKGLEGAMIIAAAKVIQPMNRYDDIEMTWIGDFNPKMIRVVESLGVILYRKHITYRKLFDATKEFKRAPIID